MDTVTTELSRFSPYVSLSNGVSAAKILINTKFGQTEPWKVIVGTAGVTYVVIWTYDLFNGEESVVTVTKKSLFRLFRRIPFVKARVEAEMKKVSEQVEADFAAQSKDMPFFVRLPESGLSDEEILDKAQDYTEMGNCKWEKGYASGVVYNGNKTLTDLMTAVYGMSAWSNPLHPEVFPGIRKMEAEVVRMCCDIYHGGPESCGVMTTGGTESIIVAMKAYRDYAREELGISRPEVIVPTTAHAAFDKGAQMLRMKIIHIPVDPVTSRANVAAMRRAINRKTCMLVASAPSFPHGCVDPVEEIAALGQAYNIPVHVDACLGSFLIPFMEEAGYPLPLFDFRVPGVTSISVDTHKYAFAPKGSSVIMYARNKFRAYQYFVVTDWPGGIYASPSIPGSRAGGIIAACWAALMYHGRQGYIDSTRRIISVARWIAEETRKIDGLKVVGEPDVSVVAMGSDHFNIYRVSDMMTRRGWHLNALQFPFSIHIAVTIPHTLPGVKERFISDMKEIVAEIMKDPKADAGGAAAIYGMSQSIPDRSLVGDIAKIFLDACYSTKRRRKQSTNGVANGVATSEVYNGATNGVASSAI